MTDPTQTIITLFNATDARDWARVQEQFHDEVSLDYSSMNSSPATTLSPSDIATAWQGILPGFQSTHHQIGNLLSTVSDNVAQVSCYGTASHYLPNEEGNLWTVVGSYDFDLVLNSKEQWKIKSMKFNFKFQDGNLNLPDLAIKQIQSSK